MALQVWLPLNGNLNNQGLCFSNFTTSTATINNSGKIGKCYNFTQNTGSGIYLSSGISCTDFMNKYINNHSWTLCAWVNTSSSSTPVMYLTFGLGFWVGSSTSISLYNSSRTVSCSTNTPSNGNVWHHVAASYNVVDNKISIYVDGILKNTNTYTSGYTYSSSWTNGIFIGRNPNNSTASDSYFYKGDINDVRIYDHCLSPKEVHEIAKGLVLHYPLDDPYSESTVNLGNTSTTYSNQTEGNAYTASSWGGDAGTITYYKSGGYNNGPYKVYHKTATGSGGIYRKTANDITIVEGKTYTMSIYVKASRDYTDSVHSFNINGVTSSDSNHYITASSSVHFTTEWTRVERTFTASANDAGTYGEMSIVYNDNVTDYYVYFSCFQIEEKDHATPFVIGTRTGDVIDTSGYLNNGTITGQLVISNNTSRYKNSVHLLDSASSIKIGNLSTMIPEKIFTFNIWFKKITDEWSTKSWETILGGPSGFELESKNGGNSSCNIVAYSWGGNSSSKYIPYQIDTWNMLTMTRDTSESKFYLNGELKYTGTAGSVPSGNYFIGAWNTATQQNYRGCLSDARLYTTILSDEDILELYNTSALIDNFGNIECYSFIEDEDIKVNKTGIINSNTFGEKINLFQGLSNTTYSTVVYENGVYTVTIQPGKSGYLGARLIGNVLVPWKNVAQIYFEAKGAVAHSFSIDTNNNPIYGTYSGNDNATILNMKSQALTTNWNSYHYKLYNNLENKNPEHAPLKIYDTLFTNTSNDSSDVVFYIRNIKIYIGDINEEVSFGSNYIKANQLIEI